jgi:hypothetical protein
MQLGKVLILPFACGKTVLSILQEAKAMVSVRRHPRFEVKFPGWFKRTSINNAVLLSNKLFKSSSGNKKISEFDHHSSSLFTVWAESFLFAGSSALLLLIANLLPCYWYFSLFALVPFLYRIIKATPTESLRLGILFGVSFFTVSLTDSFSIFPVSSILKLLLGTWLFGVFGWSVGWARKRWGFYPSFVALLWIGLESGLMKLGFDGGIMGEIKFSNPVFHEMVGLFGFLIVSAIIVLLNSLLIAVITKTLGAIRLRADTVNEVEMRFQFPSIYHFTVKRIYTVPEDRAPPLRTSVSTGTSDDSSRSDIEAAALRLFPTDNQ